MGGRGLAGTSLGATLVRQCCSGTSPCLALASQCMSGTSLGLTLAVPFVSGTSRGRALANQCMSGTSLGLTLAAVGEQEKVTHRSFAAWSTSSGRAGGFLAGEGGRTIALRAVSASGVAAQSTHDRRLRGEAAFVASRFGPTGAAVRPHLLPLPHYADVPDVRMRLTTRKKRLGQALGFLVAAASTRSCAKVVRRRVLASSKSARTAPTR